MVKIKIPANVRSSVTITIKTIKGIRYVYFSCYDKDAGGIQTKSCGAENRPESRRKAEDLERSHLKKRLGVLEAETSRVRTMLEHLGRQQP